MDPEGLDEDPDALDDEPEGLDGDAEDLEELGMSFWLSVTVRIAAVVNKRQAIKETRGGYSRVTGVLYTYISGHSGSSHEARHSCNDAPRAEISGCHKSLDE